MTSKPLFSWCVGTTVGRVCNWYISIRETLPKYYGGGSRACASLILGTILIGSIARSMIFAWHIGPRENSHAALRRLLTVRSVQSPALDADEASAVTTLRATANASAAVRLLSQVKPSTPESTSTHQSAYNSVGSDIVSNTGSQSSPSNASGSFRRRRPNVWNLYQQQRAANNVEDDQNVEVHPATAASTEYKDIERGDKHELQRTCRAIAGFSKKYCTESRSKGLFASSKNIRTSASLRKVKAVQDRAKAEGGGEKRQQCGIGHSLAIITEGALGNRSNMALTEVEEECKLHLRVQRLDRRVQKKRDIQALTKWAETEGKAAAEHLQKNSYPLKELHADFDPLPSNTPKHYVRSFVCVNAARHVSEVLQRYNVLM